MKKYLTFVLAGIMALSLAACSTDTAEDTAKEEEKTEEVVEEGTGVYTVYNTTGEKVTELYLYESGSEDKGENLAGDGLKNNRKVVLDHTGPSDFVLTLEYVTESGKTGAFETLHCEEAPINLLAEDAMTGATPIAFEVPEGTGVYTVYNTTGETVTDLYLYEAGSEDKGENLAGEGMEEGAVAELTHTGAVDFVLVLEYTTESGRTSAFETLHCEEVPISLLAEDAMTGATPIAFQAAE